jgi:GTP-binding protein EngB required for normal cell division
MEIPHNKYDMTQKALDGVKSKIDTMEESASNKYVFLGFDGYIDSLYSIVLNREDVKNWKTMDSMTQMAERIIDSAGSSTSIERILKRKVAGGFAPNTGKALWNLGVRVFLVAAMGLPKPKELFKIYPEYVEDISINEPGRTIGLEFNDGKIMITDFHNIYNITWDRIINKIKVPKLIDRFNICDGYGFGHWSLLLEMNNIWKKIQTEIFPSVSNLKEKIFYLDLADLRKRKDSDTKEMLDLLMELEDQVQICLSLNDIEAIDISRVLDGVDEIDPKQPNFENYIEAGKKINEILNFSYLIIHEPHFATISNKKKHSWVSQAYTSTPKFSTGAGDHFNGATLAGLILGLDPAEAILFGNVNTAIFVRTGESPKFKHMKKFMENYLDYVKNENPYFEMI